MIKNYQKKKSASRFFQSKPVLIFLFLILILMIWNIINLISKMHLAQKNKEVELQKIIDLERRKEKLENELEKIDTEKGKEEMIRENFGLAKEGEGVIIIVEDKKKENVELPQKNNFFIDFLKKIF